MVGSVCIAWRNSGNPNLAVECWLLNLGRRGQDYDGDFALPKVPSAVGELGKLCGRNQLFPLTTSNIGYVVL